MIRLFWAGDSMVAFHSYRTYPQTGIGQAFSLFANHDVTIFNYAKNGSSTKSFIADILMNRE
ncbi:MAG: hypothetical protein ACLRZ7_12935 [Lachnospiraceae bacterium]